MFLKPGGRLVLVDSLQSGDQPDYEGLFDIFPQNYHEPYYTSYMTEDFGTIAKTCGLTHTRDVKAFVSKVMVFDKPVGSGRQKRTARKRFENRAVQNKTVNAHRKLREKVL